MLFAKLQLLSPHLAIRNFLSRLDCRASFWSLLLLLAAGCSNGPELAPVSGRVTLDGQPLEAAEVSFEPEIGRASHGHADQNGDYELRYTREEVGALVGPHTVRILSATELTLPNGQFVLRPQVVPPRYNTQSELHREVKPHARNVFDFKLTSKAK